MSSSDGGRNNNQEGRAAFKGTRWSVVVRARAADRRTAELALSELCTIYWYPLYAFVRRSGCSHHEAEDLTQGFFHHLISRDGLAHVDPAKGRFRSFLLGSIRNFMSNERERAAAQKRGGGQMHISIDLEEGARRYELEHSDNDTPHTVYERSWALTVIQDAMKRLRSEYEEKGRKALYDALEGFMVASGAASSYSDAAKALGTSEGNIKVLIFRLRKRFGEVLRAHIAHTVESDTEIDDEIRHLMTCFGS